MKSLSVATLFSLVLVPAAFAETMSVTVKGTTNTGTVRGAIYADQGGFDEGKPVAASASPAGAGQTVLTFTDLAPGRYGIAVFQDLDGSEDLNRNIFGAPNEPFGFSNDPRIGFSAPKFEAFEFDFDSSAQDVVITLNEV